jgi:large subunit ribosomal protein L25
MKQFKLAVLPREATGRSSSRRLRSAGRIPAILYGKHTAPVNLAVNEPEFVRLLKTIAGSAAIIELARDNSGPALSVLKEIQRDPITDRYLHVDLQEVKADEKMELDVRVNLIGESTGVKNDGGILDLASHTLRIRCLPKDLPEFIVVDVTELKVGNSIFLRQLKPIPNVEFRGSPSQPVVSCVEPPAEEVVAPAADAAAVPAEGAAAAPAAGDAKAGAPAGDAKAAGAAGDKKGAAPAAGEKKAGAPAGKPGAPAAGGDKKAAAPAGKAPAPGKK